MKHPKLVEWEERLKKLFDEVDDYLEDTYGDLYPLHPNRARRGTTSHKGHDGLFNVGATFSAGFGSRHGRGYVIEVDLVTLSHIPREVEEQIQNDVLKLVRKKLTEYFPERDLEVSKDGRVYKIHGDLSLGYM
ncbi:MAG: hypothetical protein JXB03_08385 [Spirochaetales bacterium]|nr:hypothetical protein [Spirochaetales bacterium]